MNCKIIGYYLKSLEVELQSSESFYYEKGAIIYHESFICIDANAQNQMESSFSGGGLLGGEGLTMFRVQ